VAGNSQSTSYVNLRGTSALNSSMCSTHSFLFNGHIFLEVGPIAVAALCRACRPTKSVKALNRSRDVTQSIFIQAGTRRSCELVIKRPVSNGISRYYM